jgi:hypothetical protein
VPDCREITKDLTEGLICSELGQPGSSLLQRARVNVHVIIVLIITS